MNPRNKTNIPPAVQNKPSQTKSTIFSWIVFASDAGVAPAEVSVAQANNPDTTKARLTIPTKSKQTPNSFITEAKLFFEC